MYSFDPDDDLLTMLPHQKNRYNIYNNWEMKTFSSIYDMLSTIHGNDTIIDYLKMDIESGEWRVIPQMMESGILMDRVRQIGMEVHLGDVYADQSLKRIFK